MDAEVLEDRGCPWLYNEFKASLGNMRTCLKKERKKKAGVEEGKKAGGLFPEFTVKVLRSKLGKARPGSCPMWNLIHSVSSASPTRLGAAVPHPTKSRDISVLWS